VRIKVTFALGTALTWLAVFAVLQHSPLIAAGGDAVEARTRLGVVGGAGSYCQPGESLPRQISAIRLSFAATTGPAIAVTVISGRHVITGGTVGSGWYGTAVTVPVRPLLRPHSDVTICARFGALAGEVDVLGAQAGVAAAGQYGLVPGQVGIVYLRPSAKSWWSRMDWVIGHMAPGGALSGAWIMCAIVALVAAAVVLAAIALSRELG
jgi:hypothetical protein